LLCLVNITEDYGIDMELNQMEQETVVLEQLEWLLAYELKHDQDHHLIASLERVIEEFKPMNVEINK
jgi:hypothetical protein